jgi:mRNA interferase RelE/StbE
MFELRYLPGAERYFKKIKEKGLQEAFRKALAQIAEDPYQGQIKIGDLAGIYGWDVYYNKTNYEIAYRVYEENGNVVVVILAGTRENFYNQLKRYMK